MTAEGLDKQLDEVMEKIKPKIKEQRDETDQHVTLLLPRTAFAFEKHLWADG